MSKSISDAHSDGNMPKHMAIVMDGNGRWAKSRGMPRAAGHKAGVDSVRRAVKYCLDHDIKALTIFAFSSENWQRPKLEVTGLKQLFFLSLRKEIKNLIKQNVRIRFIGDLTAFGEKLQKEAHKAQEATKNNSELEFNIALNYGGQWDICQAAQKLAQQVKFHELAPEQIDPELFASQLVTAGTPDVDLFIRTSGEQRISNFLLWQIAYAELYFCDSFWPDFDDAEMDKAIEWFQNRNRRFGKTQSQVDAVEKL